MNRKKTISQNDIIVIFSLRSKKVKNLYW